MLKTILRRALIGFIFGMILGDGIAFLTSLMADGTAHWVSMSLASRCGGELPAFIVQSLLSGIYGAITFAGITIYDLERIPLALASFLHCALIVLLHIPNALFLGWEETLADVLIMAGIQIVVCFMIWLILFFIYRKQVKEINKLQKEINERKEKKDTEKQS